MKKDLNVVLIISDTLRRDHVSCYGNRTIKTPNLDNLAKRCRIFDRAYVASFPTMPMRADLFTGKYTMTYLGWEPLPRNEVILSQTLADNGYLTAAVVDTPFFVSRGYSYDRGFHDFRTVRGQGIGVNIDVWHGGVERIDTTYERRYEEDYCAPRTGAHAERWLERHYKEKFFLYVDMWDPHEPWDPPAHYVEQYYPKWDGTKVPPSYYYWKKRGKTQKDIDIAHACYSGEVTMVDRAVGRIIDRIESLGILENTMILFTSDHGFCFGEHGLFGKALIESDESGWNFVGSPFYEEITRVPLMVYLPGAKSGRSSAIVQPPDHMPTILDLLGIKIPDTVQGRSYASVVKTGKGSGRSFAVSSMPLYNPGDTTRAVDDYERRIRNYLQVAISSGPWTMLYERSGKPVELYNIQTDPKQKKNVAKKHPEIVKRLHRKYYSLIKECGAPEEKLEPRANL